MKSQPKLEAEMTHAASTQSNLLMPSLALGCGCGGRKQGRAQRGLGNYSAGAAPTEAASSPTVSKQALSVLCHLAMRQQEASGHSSVLTCCDSRSTTGLPGPQVLQAHSGEETAVDSL